MPKIESNPRLVLANAQSLSFLVNKLNFEILTETIFELCIQIKGSYDRMIYVLSVKDGSVHWRIETGDVVKSSPTLDLDTGFIFIGSHDKHVYCLNIQVSIVFYF
jgi:hypothetical protein